MAEKARRSGSKAKLRLGDFEKKIRIRQLTLDDYDDLVAMQARCFPGMKTWGRDQIESQTSHFPEGQIGIELQGRLVGASCSLIVDYDRYVEWHDWQLIADRGYIGNHTPTGDTLYGIELMVDPDFRGMHLARRLYDARKELCRKLNLARIVIGGRIPGYGAQPEEMTAQEYVEEVMARGLYDPVLTTQIANGFVLRELIPEYFPSDEASRGYATHLEWTNLSYVRNPNRTAQRGSTARICVVQYQMRPVRSWDAFKTQCSFFIDAAATSKADFVLFPELLTNQLMGLEPGRRPADTVRTLAERTPDYLDFFSSVAIKHNVNIVGGSQFTFEDSRLLNVAYLFRRDGTIERQPKLHVTPDEQRWWGLEAGDGLHVFETDRAKVAILTSLDVLHPELASAATQDGAEILFVPFLAEDRTGYLRFRYCAQARAVENNVFVALSGSTGNLPFVDHTDVHYAQSGIFTPLDYGFARDGIAAESPPNVETLITADVDLDVLAKQRVLATASEPRPAR